MSADTLADQAPAGSLPAAAPATVRVLGCSGSIAQGCHTTAFLLDDDVLLDAGSGVGELTLDALTRIDHVLLSHAHLDHVLGLPLLADSVMRRRRGRPPIQVHALPETLAVLRQHLFNDQLWPDFTRLPQADEPVLALHPLAVGQTLTLGARQRQVRVLPARHSVPAVGFAVLGAPGSAWGDWAYTGDTGPNPALWQALAGLRLRQLVIELAFPESEQPLAALSLHHCPSSLAAELAHLPADVEVLLTHLKPGDAPAALAELATRLRPSQRASALHAGQQLRLG